MKYSKIFLEFLLLTTLINVVYSFAINEKIDNANSIIILFVVNVIFIFSLVSKKFFEAIDDSKSPIAFETYKLNNNSNKIIAILMYTSFLIGINFIINPSIANLVHINLPHWLFISSILLSLYLSFYFPIKNFKNNIRKLLARKVSTKK